MSGTVRSRRRLLWGFTPPLDRCPDLMDSSNKAKWSLYTWFTKMGRTIDSVKNSEAYQRYIKAVPRHARQARHPQTPDRFDCTIKRRALRFKVYQWKTALKEWDPSEDTTASKSDPSVRPGSYNRALKKSRFDQPAKDQGTPTSATKLQEAADLERKWSSFRELIREHRQKQQTSGASPSGLPHAEQLRTGGSNREEYAEKSTSSMAITPARPGESERGQNLVGSSGLFTETKDYVSRRGGWDAAPSASWAAASPADSLSQHPIPPSRTASTQPPAEQRMVAVPDTEILRLIRSIDAHNDDFDHFGKRIAARCRILPSEVRSKLQAVIEGVVAAYQLADPARLPASACVVDLLRNLCGISPSLPTVSLAPQLPPGATATQTALLSVFNSVTLSSLPSQPPSLHSSTQPVPPAPRNYLQSNPSAPHNYTQPTPPAPQHYTQPSSAAYTHPLPRYYTQPAPSASLPPPTSAYFAASYKPPFK